VGRNFAEILRALDAVQADRRRAGSTMPRPPTGTPGQDVIVALSLNDDARPVTRSVRRAGHQAALSCGFAQGHKKP
jgi:hypothetical protein